MDIKQILNTAVGGYSLSKILSALVTLLVCLIAVRLIMKVVTRLLSRMQKINERLQKIIHTSIKALLYVLTVIITGAFIFFLSRIEKIGLSLSIVMCFLLAAVMSSTDSASVFSILKNSKMKLKENLRPMLELESGSNDPMAYVLTIVLIQIAKLLFDPAAGIEGIDYGQMILGVTWTLTKQMTIGTLAGALMGLATVWALTRIKLNSTPLYSILLLAVSMFTFSLTQMIQGNGYLAVYIAGFIIGNKPMNHRKEILSFMDGPGSCR